ncbi:hypothetical protein N9S22_04890 [Paracoccaceae bacterium]|nr:hypothetical protein [Paracoccaceae bacterium]
MADKLRSIYVDEMIDDWYSLEFPIIKGKLNFLTDKALGSNYYGSDGHEFILEHFNGDIHTGLKKLSASQEDWFTVLASRHRKVWEALRKYIIWLLENNYELNEEIRFINTLMLEGYEPNYPKAQGAAVAGRIGRYYWRDFFIALTVDLWRNKYNKMPIKNYLNDGAEDQITICSLIYTALNKMRPYGETTPQPDRIYKIYLKARKDVVIQNNAN